MLREQRQAGWADSTPVMMYNPPLTLALAMPAGALDFRLARSIWLPLQLFLALWSAACLWTLYGGAPSRGSRAWFIALLWSPTLLALRFGQLSPIILAGLVGFLWCVTSGRDSAAGAFFALTAVKPQLTAIVWVAFVLWAVADRRWKTLASAAGCIAAASAVVLAFNPRVFTEYFALMALAPPTMIFESPNIATFGLVLAHTRSSWPQYVPVALGSLAVAASWYRDRLAWDWRRRLPGLIVLSVLVTPYGGWAFDLVVLLVPIVALAATLAPLDRPALAAAGAAIFLAVSGLALTMHMAQVAQAAFVWMTPVVAVTWWALQRAAPQPAVS
jgi:hypothetical protein